MFLDFVHREKSPLCHHLVLPLLSLACYFGCQKLNMHEDLTHFLQKNSLSKCGSFTFELKPIIMERACFCQLYGCLPNACLSWIWMR